MSALSLRLPKSFHEQFPELAQVESVSVDPFVMVAVAEKVAALSTSGGARVAIVNRRAARVMKSQI